MLMYVHAFIFNGIYFTALAVLCLAFVWSVLLPPRMTFWVARFVFGVLAVIEKYIGGIDYQVVGKENLPEGCVIIAAKHQSVWETFRLHQLFRDPAIVLKKELLSVPIWGWYMARTGMIPVDRTGRGAALNAMVVSAEKAKDDGRKIVIFVQGTRVKPLEKRPYKSGVAALYQALDVPVVPMALNSGVFWPKHRFLKQKGTITVEFLPAIAPGLDRQAFMDQLTSVLEAASDRLAQKPQFRS